MAQHDSDSGQEFLQGAARKRRGLIAEFSDFLMDNKKWWLGPIVFAILILGALVFLGGTAAAPFVYTLF
jgi:hypothetical protein